MLKSAFPPLLFLFILSCVTPLVTEEPQYSTGWLDNDTYIVMVSGVTEQHAVENAKHRILKDIVEVRVRNKSRYTDIVIIREEFALPLGRGKIIDIKSISGGVQILFQIRDTDLRNKFLRL